MPQAKLLGLRLIAGGVVLRLSRSYWLRNVAHKREGMGQRRTLLRQDTDDKEDNTIQI